MYTPQIIVIALYTLTAFADDAPVVETLSGAVRGFTSRSRSGRVYWSYTGIPFAKPPLGKLRFKPPEEPEPWTGIRNATENGPFCIQYDMFQLNPKVIGSEDCLYLSVFTHDIHGKVPVIVYIHGGGFIVGDKSKRSPIYFMDQDIVIEVYLLEDLKGQPISGSFYAEELQKVKYPDVYLVEKVLKRKGNKLYVKWLGLDERSWIDKKDIA